MSYCCLFLKHRNSSTPMEMQATTAGGSRRRGRREPAGMGGSSRAASVPGNSGGRWSLSAGHIHPWRRSGAHGAVQSSCLLRRGLAVEARRRRGVARRGRPPLLKAEVRTVVRGAPEVDNGEEQQGWEFDDGTVTTMDLAQSRPAGGRSSQARSGSSSRARPSGTRSWVRCRLGEASEDRSEEAMALPLKQHTRRGSG